MRQLTTVLHRLLLAAPSWLVAAGFTIHTVGRDIPASLTAALGPLDIGWIIGLIGTSFTSGLLEAIDPDRQRVRVLRAATLIHIAAATFLAGYGVGLLFGAGAPITAGMVFGAAAVHVIRWRRIVTSDIPAALYIASRS